MFVYNSDRLGRFISSRGISVFDMFGKLTKLTEIEKKKFIARLWEHLFHVMEIWTT